MIITLVGAGAAEIVSVPPIFKGDSGDDGVDTIARTAAAQADEKAESALTVSLTYSSYSAAVIASNLPFINRISANVGGTLVEWIRDSSGNALSGGWTPSGKPTPKHYGATGNGETDDTLAVQNCLRYHGELNLDSYYLVTAALVVPANLSTLLVQGTGGIKWFGDILPVNLWNFVNYSVSNKLPLVKFRGISIRGSHDQNRSFVASYPLLISNTIDVSIIDCEISYSRVMGIAVRGAGRVTVSDCHVHHCARDGINVADCVETTTVGNRVHDCDDDAIAVHNQIYRWSRGHVITGNKIRKAQGIRALGVNNLTITGNVLEFYINQGVSVTTEQAGGVNQEGVNAAFSVVISGNVFSDPINRAGLDNLNSGSYGIVVNGRSAQVGDTPYIPGLSSDPKPYYGNVKHPAANLASTPVPVSGEFSVTGNVFKRTMPRTGMFSTLGFGLFWMRGGELDYNMGLSNANSDDCIRLNGGIFNNFVSSGNVYSGFRNFLSIIAGARPRGWKFTGDTISDITTCGVSLPSEDASFDVSFLGCTFDLDPYHSHVLRGATGGWTNEASGPTAIISGISRGYSFVECDFKNMSRISDETPYLKVNSGRMEFKENRIWCDPQSTGFNVNNGGVGRIDSTSGPYCTIVVQVCDPNSPNYGNIVRRGKLAASVISEVSGFFLNGEYVAKVNQGIQGTAPNRYVVRGWIRVISGSGTAQGVDWVEDRMYIGS